MDINVIIAKGDNGACNIEVFKYDDENAEMINIGIIKNVTCVQVDNDVDEGLIHKQ